MGDFGDTWKSADVSFWDGMWEKHRDSLMTKEIIGEVLGVDRVIEVGCGVGHIIREAVGRGWRGEYTGVDISKAALGYAQSRWKGTASFVCGDFLDLRRGLPPADLVISRGVLQHQVHWMPMVAAALQCAPRVVMGIGYTTDRKDRHLGGWQNPGHYDILVSLPRMRVESEAAGLPLLSIAKYPNQKRPGHQEALAIFDMA